MSERRRVIITPTFRPHFGFNRDFLHSYFQKATDAAQIPVHFVVGREEVVDLTTITEEFPALDVHVHALEDLLAQEGHDLDAGELLTEIGKFAFQAVKKLYALKVLEYDQALIMDSESLLLRATSMATLFDEYFVDPVIYYSDLDHRSDSWYGSLSDTVTGNAATLLGTDYPRRYLLEYYGWFYDKALVEGMFAAMPGGDLLGTMRSRLGRQKAVFESVLYYTYLLTVPDSHDHRFVSVNELLREHLGAARYADYIANFRGRWEAFGIFEYLSKEVTDENVEALLGMFRQQRLRFYRSELLNDNADAQDRLLESSDVVVLASSEHYKRMHQRVAVCLSGQARNYRQNLRFLRTFLRDSGADVFFHLWDTPDKEYITRSLAPAAHVFQDQRAWFASEEFVDVARVASRRERFAPPTRDRGSAAMFYGIWRANELKREHERASDFRYDVVVRIRLDLLSLDTLNDVLDRISAAQQGLEDTIYVPDMAQSVGLNDQIAAGSSEAMDTYASAYQNLEAFAAKEYFNPEYFLLRHVLGQGLTIRTFPLEYVLLRDDDVTLFELDSVIRGTTGTWWSAPLPPISPALFMDHFRAKARSVALVAEGGFETPVLARLRHPDGRLLTVNVPGRSLRFAAVGDDDPTSHFFLVVGADEDRTVVDLRCADLGLSHDGRGWTIVPDVDGVLHPDGEPGTRSAFYLGGSIEALTLEWRPGFWQGLDRREDTRKGQSDKAARRFVADSGSGPALGTSDGALTLRLEPVNDLAAQHAPIGMVAGVSTGAAQPGESRLVVLAWKLLEGARVYEEHGMGEFVNRSAVLMRRSIGAGDAGGRPARIADRALAALQRRT